MKTKDTVATMKKPIKPPKVTKTVLENEEELKKVDIEERDNKEIDMEVVDTDDKNDIRGEHVSIKEPSVPTSKKLQLHEVLNQSESLNSVNTSKSRSGAGKVSLIFHKTCGARVSISREVTDLTENEEEIYMGISGNMLLLSGKPKERLHKFDLKKQGKKFLIYNKSLVLEIAGKLSLDFSTGRTSYTLGMMEVIEEGTERLIVVKE